MKAKQDLNTEKIDELQNQLNELKSKTDPAETPKPATQAKSDPSPPNSAIKIVGIIVAVALLLGCFSTLGFGIYKYTKDEDDSGNNESAVIDEREITKEQEKKIAPSNIDNSTDDVVTSDAEDDEIEDNQEGEYLDTEVYEFKFKVADISKYSIVEEWSEAAGKNYSILIYCYELNDTSFDEDPACGIGKAGIFFISVFDPTQWAEYQIGPFGSGATLIGQNNSIYYALESTEGFVPAELETEIDSILETVRDSFEITGQLDEI